MTFQDNGNVGIGTSSPSYKLDVVGASGSVFRSTFSGKELVGFIGSSEVFFGSNTNHPLGFLTNGSERMRIDSSGNLCLGTTIAVSNGFNLGGVQQINFDGGAANAQINNYRSQDLELVNRVAGNGISFYVGNGSYAGKFDSSGNVGIGVTPSAWVAGHKALQFSQNTSLSSVGNSMLLAQNYFTDGTSKYLANGFATLYEQNKGDGGHKWYTAPSGTAGNTISFTQAMTLDASGRLLVGGTSAPASGEVKAVLTGGASAGPSFLTFQNNSTNTGCTIGTTGQDFTVFTNTGATGSESYTERMRIDSSGNVGIGTTTTSNGRLSVVAGTGTTGNSLFLSNLDGTYNSFVQIQHSSNGVKLFASSSAGGAASALTLSTPGGDVRLDASGNVGIGTSSPDSKFHVESATARIRIGFNATSENYYDANVQYWRNSSGAERMRIDSSGNLLVGIVSNNYHTIAKNLSGDWAASVRNTNGSSPFGLTSLFTSASPNGASNEFFYCADSSAARMTVRSNGGIANFSGNNVNLSDRREKTNFAPAKSYLDVICAIPVQTFNYIDQNNDEDPGLTLGVVAQDVQAVAPEFVMESNWGTEDEPKMRLSIYQTDLQYALMKCIQEQQALIQDLTTRLTTLEGN
jgi:hypothetical protein